MPRGKDRTSFGSISGSVSAILTSPVINTGVSGTAIDTDATMAANSDTLLVSQKAIKTALALKSPIASPTFTGTVTSVGDVIGNASLTLNSTTIPTLAADTISALKIVQSSVHVVSVSELTFIGTGLNVASTIDLRRVNATYAQWTAGTVSAVTIGQNLGGIHIGATTPTLLLDCATFYCVADATFLDGSPADSAHASTPTAWECYTTPASTSNRTQTLAWRANSDQSFTVTNKLNVYTVAPATQTAAYNMVDIANATAFTNNAAALTTMGVNLAPVITYSTGVGGGNIGWRGFYDTSTHQSSVANGLTGTFYSFHSSPTVKASGNTNAETIGTLQGFRSDVTLVAGGATGTITVTSLTQFAAPAITVPANGTVTTLNQINIAGPVATGTITTRRAINISDGSGAGTFTTNVGIDIAVLAAGGTNIGIRNAATLLQIGDCGFHGAAVTGQSTTAAAAPAGGTGATAGAYDTAAHRDTHIALSNAMRTCLRDHGLMA